MFRFICILFVLLASTVASAQQYRPMPQPQPQLYQVQMVFRPAWPFGCRYVLRPMFVPVQPQQMPQQ